MIYFVREKTGNNIILSSSIFKKMENIFNKILNVDINCVNDVRPKCIRSIHQHLNQV